MFLYYNNSHYELIGFNFWRKNNKDTKFKKEVVTIFNVLDINSNTSEITDLAGQLAEIKELLKEKAAIKVKVTPPPIKIEFTPREQSVLELVVEGLMNKEIAKRLGTTIRNVEKYVSRLFSKTGTSSRTELVRYALQHGLIEAYS